MWAAVGRQYFTRCAVALTAAGLLLSGCARYDEPTAAPFAPVPDTVPLESGPRNPSPPGQQDPNQPPAEPTPLPGACGDLTPGVIAGCLDTTGALIMLPGGAAALVAERLTGRILRVSPGSDTTEFARVPVDPTGDGGLTGLALSPTFDEDQLVFAYVTTPSDNRVVRIAPGDTPKEIFTGIPKGPTGNAGAIAFATPTQLMVLTGDAGNPAAAIDPGSRAGKLLRLQAGDPVAAPQQIAAGMGAAGGLCLDPKSGSLWVTDRAPTMDRLQVVVPDGTSASQVWTWADRPGVGGCAAAEQTVVVALDGGRALSAVVTGSGGAVLGDPQLIAKDQYGSYGSTAIAADGTIWAATVNKAGPTPAPTDDRVVQIQMTSGLGGLV